MQAAKTTLLALAALTMCAACGQPRAPASGAADDSSASGEQDYRPSPELVGVAPAGGGRIELAGVAAPGAAVRLSSASGLTEFARADHHGDWRLNIPPAPEPRLLSLAMSDHGRVVQAMGYLFVAPDGAVARLRAGGGSQMLSPAASGLPEPALDYDSQRAATFSGRLAPGEAVSLRVDGVERGQGAAGASGRFVLALNQPLAAGAHDFDLAEPSGDVRFSADIDAPARLDRALFSAARTALGWRIDWVTPGGGEQTTLLFERVGPAS